MRKALRAASSLNNAAARGIIIKKKTVPLIKALKMMMELSGGLNHGAGCMLIGLRVS